MSDQSMPLKGRSFRASRTVHIGSTFAYGKLSQLFPGLVVSVEGEEGEPDAIAFADPDGDVHVYALSAEAKRALVEKMTGGVAVATAILPGDLRR